MSSETRYTLAEAEAEMRRRECANGGHAPDTVIRQGWGAAIRAYCSCGAVTWKPDPEGSK